MKSAFSVAFLFVLFGCGLVNSYAEIENQSKQTLTNIRLVLEEKPDNVIPLKDIPPGSLRQEKLPHGFGESALRFEAGAAGTLIGATCGYLESDGMYTARIVVHEDLTASCDVDLL
jgi:hypothetical protein